jgi:small-conductance mechanosensitive channel
MSAIIGNMLSAGLMLTTFPAKIGDSIYIVNDKIRGRVEEINFIYTKIITAEGTEYVVPNNAIVQGNVRIIRDAPIQNSELPYSEGDHLELTNSSHSYCGVVSKVSTNFTTLCSKENKNEVILANSSILSGKFIIIKKITRSEESKNTKGNIAQ